MSVQSKFYSVTNQVLLEYKTDQYSIINTHSKVGAVQRSLYMYQGDDGHQYCTTTNNIRYNKYPDSNDSTYYYGGVNVSTFDLEPILDDTIFGSDIYINTEHNVGTTLKDANGLELRENIYLNEDTIRIYLVTGYVMNNIAGYSIKVKAKINNVSYVDSTGTTTYKRLTDYIYLLDWFMPKEELKDNIHWLSQPLYLNSKFYDRYIEISFPSPIDAALNDRDIDYIYDYLDPDTAEHIYMRGKIDSNSVYIVEFATVQPENIDFVSNTKSMYECSFVLDSPKQIALSMSSNANYFNVRLKENTSEHTIEYYPVYGDDANEHEFDLDIMNEIETGAIPMYDMADMDSLNEGIDDFIEMYGDDVYRWVIINELTVSYNYSHIITTDTRNDIETYTEYYTNTIDYTGKSSDKGEFWKTKFIPYIKSRLNLTCKSIVIAYTAHLFNRMNNIDIIRTASMTITNPYKYALSQINTNNVLQYKIVNKIESPTVSIMPGNTSTNNGEKLVRSYYNVTNLIAKDSVSGNMYSQGKMTIYLTHSNNNYMIKLYTTNDDNTRVPYNLTGNTDYKLVFPTVNGNKLNILPNKDSENYNLGIGSLIFYITEDQAKTIMQVPASERYFALTTNMTNSLEESTLYEGNVEWI